MPPPLMPSSPTNLTASSTTSEALSQSLYKSIPHSALPHVKSRAKNITLHPTRPWMTYLLDNNISTDTTRNLELQQQIVVQDYTSGNVEFQLSIPNLCVLLYNIDRSSSAYSTKLIAALNSLGMLHRVEFYDSSALCAKGMIYDESNEPNSQADNAPYQKTSAAEFSYLILQFASRLVILNLMQGSTLSAHRNKAIVAQITKSSLQGTIPSSMMVPLSPSLLLVGCAEGSLKVYDWKSEQVLSTGHPPSSKNDPILQLLSANQYNSRHLSHKQVLRAISVSKKSTAYLWEIVLSKNGGNDMLDVSIGAPIYRMDGMLTMPKDLSSLLSPGIRSPPSGAPTMAMGTGSGSSSNTASLSMYSANDFLWWDHVLLDFDAHRNLFFWFVPTGFKNSSRPSLLVWDLSLPASSKKKKSVVSKQDPYIVVFPSIDAPVTLVAGWTHPAFPNQCLLCALVNQMGDLFLQVVNLEDCKTGKSCKAYTWSSASLTNLIQKELDTMTSPLVRAYSIFTHRRLNTSALCVGTNLGIIQVDVSHERGGAISVGACPCAHYLSPSIYGTDWGKAVITVNESRVLWEPLDVEGKNPHGKIDVLTHDKYKQSQVIYQSQPAIELLPEIQKRSVRLPPRFLPSPNGKFLCLFWVDEQWYEILHVSTSLRRGNSFAPAVASGTNILDFCWVGDEDVFALLHPPLEHYKGNSSLTASSQSEGTISVGSSAVKNFRKNFNMGRHKQSDRNIFDSEPASFKKNGIRNNKFVPRVELKRLIGVTANASELGSIAAATARSIGEISLRAGNLHPPTALFGGPNLCVISKDPTKNNDKEDGHSNDVAHFYTLKPGAEELTAQNFVHTGPTLFIDCPEFCEWDDTGTLCALVVQGFVTIYRSKDEEFVMLGNMLLGAPSERQVTVIDLKFIHGTLYCTTRTTVQCIFFGGLDDETGICNLDSFILASAEGPTMFYSNSGLDPLTSPLTLNHPTILGYQSGSLLVSTINGIFAISLDHPLLRLGVLLGAGHTARAERWLEAISPDQHEGLTEFLCRRGAAESAVNHCIGLSLETLIDLCLRYGFIDRLVQLVEEYGVVGIRQVDYGRGISVGILGPQEHGHSLLVCVAALLLGNGRIEIVDQMVFECLNLGPEAQSEAMILTSLLMAVHPTEARKLLQAVVRDTTSTNDEEYPLLPLVRDYIL